MNVDDLPTQPLAFPTAQKPASKPPINYQWLKTLAELSGTHLLHVHRFMLGRNIPEIEAARIQLTLRKLTEIRGKKR